MIRMPAVESGRLTIDPEQAEAALNEVEQQLSD